MFRRQHVRERRRSVLFRQRSSDPGLLGHGHRERPDGRARELHVAVVLARKREPELHLVRLEQMVEHRAVRDHVAERLGRRALHLLVLGKLQIFQRPDPFFRRDAAPRGPAQREQIGQPQQTLEVAQIRRLELAARPQQRPNADEALRVREAVRVRRDEDLAGGVRREDPRLVRRARVRVRERDARFEAALLHERAPQGLVRRQGAERLREFLRRVGRRIRGREAR
mmetsp:Transcript_28771/g.89146  ORF Transcript_28771/g.89146 Transcript_28771/m.89146 type:complete len:226 (-) Transcript_28771:544-1221(-)